MTSINDWLNMEGNDPNDEISNALTTNKYDLTRDLGSITLARQTVETELNNANVPGNLIVNFLDDAYIRQQERRSHVILSACSICLFAFSFAFKVHFFLDVYIKK